MCDNCETTEHEWREIGFSYGGWIECACGFRPQSQEDMDDHAKRRF